MPFFATERARNVFLQILLEVRNRYDFALLLGADPARIEGARTTAGRAPDVSLCSSRAAAVLSTRLRGVREVLTRP